MDFNDIATVSGKSGLYKIVSPTRNGMILESMDEQKKRLAVNANSKVSVLGEIGIYTTGKEGSCPIQQVMHKVHLEFAGDTGLTGNSNPEELKSFLKHVLPTYDQDRVYVSDIKKLVNWYHLLAKNHADLLVEKPEEKRKEDNAEKGND